MTSPGGSAPPQRRQRRRTVPHSREPAAAAACAMAFVLTNHDLLAEILLRVGSPAWLVRAALVSKSWLRVASDAAFLDRFRVLHPPRILALTSLRISNSPGLIPVPQPPDLAAAAHLAGRAIRKLGKTARCSDYCNGRLLLESTGKWLRYAVVGLLQKAKKKILPPAPPLGSADRDRPGLLYRNRMFLMEDDGISCLSLTMECDKATVRADFSILRSGVWGVPQSAEMELEQDPFFTVLGYKLLSGGKVYMLTSVGCILALDLATATFSAIELPDGEVHCTSIKFSRAKQSGLYVICATSFQLRVWHCDGATGQLALVDTISVREACAELNVQRWVPDDDNTAPVSIVGVGDNVEFVILELIASKIMCCMQLGNRVVEKVVEGMLQNHCIFMRPITMVWPPLRPVPPMLQ